MVEKDAVGWAMSYRQRQSIAIRVCTMRPLILWRISERVAAEDMDIKHPQRELGPGQRPMPGPGPERRVVRASTVVKAKSDGLRHRLSADQNFGTTVRAKRIETG